MKTYKFKVLRLACVFVIAITLAINATYFGFYIWNKSVFDVEKSLLANQTWTVQTFSVYMIYSNILCAFLFGYAFNIGSKYFLKIVSLITLIVNGFGIFSWLYTYMSSVKALQYALSNSMFTPGNFNMSIYSNYPGDNFINVQNKILTDYKYIISYFQMYELCSALCLLTLTIIGVTTRLIKINVEKEKPHIVNEIVYDNSASMKPYRMLITSTLEKVRVSNEVPTQI